MTLPVTIPNTFANATTSIPLANLDANFVTIYGAVNGIGNGAEALANVNISGGNVNVTTVTASSNVGIGTSSPSTKLELSANDSVALRLTSTDTGATADDVLGVVEFYGSDASSAGAGVKSSIVATAQGTGGAASDLRFYTSPGATNNEQRMVIDLDGNVGIGTSSPVALLTASNSGALTLDSNDGDETGFALFCAPSTITANTVNSAIGFGSTAGRKYAAIGMQTYSDADQNGLNFYVQSQATGSSAVLTEAMRITSSGEVLVGGTTGVDATSFLGSNAPHLTVEGTNIGALLALFCNDTAIVSTQILGGIGFYGADTTSNTPTLHAYVAARASGTHAAGDNPTDLVFGVTADGTDAVYEALRIRQDGTLDSQDTYDNTQSGSTVVVTSAGLIGRTSSSIKYKKDVETLDAELVDNAITNLRPVWYRTKDAKGDDKETWSHIGLIAEEVHEVEPRLVRYRTEKVEFVDIEEQVTKTREVSPAVTDEEGSVVQEAVTEEYTETVTRKEKQKSLLEIPEPEDVDYGRLAVLCLAKIQQQEQTIAALEARIAALEQA